MLGQSTQMRITHSSRGTLEAKTVTERRIQCGINHLLQSEIQIHTIPMQIRSLLQFSHTFTAAPNTVSSRSTSNGVILAVRELHSSSTSQRRSGDFNKAELPARPTRAQSAPCVGRVVDVAKRPSNEYACGYYNPLAAQQYQGSLYAFDKEYDTQLLHAKMA